MDNNNDFGMSYSGKRWINEMETLQHELFGQYSPNVGVLTELIEQSEVYKTIDEAFGLEPH